MALLPHQVDEGLTSLGIGKQGIHNFTLGCYVYIGCTLIGLHGRLKHNLKSEKLLHWHIDYLLQQATVVINFGLNGVGGTQNGRHYLSYVRQSPILITLQELYL